jgi:ABC-type sulfate transport system permease component
MSVWTSFLSTFLALLFAVPVGYALSRFSFPGRVLADAVVDLPIVFPPLVVGLTLLVFFSQTALGKWIQDDLGMEFVLQPKGIVLCQFVAAASFAIRSAKTAFDDVDLRYEEAFSIADRAAILHNGVLEQIGTMDELVMRPNSDFVARFMRADKHNEISKS